MVSPTLPFASKTQESNAEVYKRERDEIAREQQQREQRSLSSSIKRWVADPGPFCASLKFEDRETMALRGSQEVKEQDTVDHTKV